MKGCRLKKEAMWSGEQMETGYGTAATQLNLAGWTEVGEEGAHPQ